MHVTKWEQTRNNYFKLTTTYICNRSKSTTHTQTSRRAHFLHLKARTTHAQNRRAHFLHPAPGRHRQLKLLCFLQDVQGSPRLQKIAPAQANHRTYLEGEEGVGVRVLGWSGAHFELEPRRASDA